MRAPVAIMNFMSNPCSTSAQGPTITDMRILLKKQSGVAPANQTQESEVREFSGKESGISSGTPLFDGFVYSVYKQKGVPDSFPESS